MSTYVRGIHELYKDSGNLKIYLSIPFIIVECKKGVSCSQTGNAKLDS